MKWKALYLLALCSMLWACQPPGSNDQETAKNDEEEAEPVPVEIAHLQRGEINALYVGTATLEADGEAAIKAKVGGEIIRLFVEEGDVVRAGQALAKIEDSKLRLETERALANLEKIRKDYQRNIELHDKGLLPAGTFESMKYDLDALEATYQLSRLELSYTTIKAPISGVVSARNIKVGNNVAPGEPVFTITDLDPLLAYLFIPEKDFRKLSANQLVNFTVDAIPGQNFSGEIARLSPVVDPTTGTFKVTIEVVDQEQVLKPGMFGRVSIIYETIKDAVLAPRSAMVDRDGETMVFVVENDIAYQRMITTGHINGSNIQIVDGLDGTERVVIVGQNGLKDNGAVKVIGSADKSILDTESGAQTAVAQGE